MNYLFHPNFKDVYIGYNPLCKGFIWYNINRPSFKSFKIFYDDKTRLPSKFIDECYNFDTREEIEEWLKRQ